MKDHGQQARASENFAGPVDFETPRPDLPVHFLNFQKPWLKFSLALACWPLSVISPGYTTGCICIPPSTELAVTSSRRRTHTASSTTVPSTQLPT